MLLTKCLCLISKYVLSNFSTNLFAALMAYRLMPTKAFMNKHTLERSCSMYLRRWSHRIEHGFGNPQHESWILTVGARTNVVSILTFHKVHYPPLPPQVILYSIQTLFYNIFLSKRHRNSCALGVKGVNSCHNLNNTDYGITFCWIMEDKDGGTHP